MSRQKKWTQKDEEYLLKTLEKKPVEYVAKKLGRSKNSIYSRLNTLGLNLKHLNSGVYASELAKIIDRNSTDIFYWMQNNGLPFRKQGGYRMVEVEEFWKWAKENTHLVNINKIPRNVLIPEPDWVEDFRLNKQSVIKFKEFTEDDIELIKFYVFKTNMNSEEIGKLMFRSKQTIVNKIRELGLSENMRGRDNNLWKKSHEIYLMKKYREGLTNKEIGKILNRSEAAIRKKIYIMLKKEKNK